MCLTLSEWVNVRTGWPNCVDMPVRNWFEFSSPVKKHTIVTHRVTGPERVNTTGALPACNAESQSRVLADHRAELKHQHSHTWFLKKTRKAQMPRQLTFKTQENITVSANSCNLENGPRSPNQYKHVKLNQAFITLQSLKGLTKSVSEKTLTLRFCQDIIYMKTHK